jgi:hypothetical protein
MSQSMMSMLEQVYQANVKIGTFQFHANDRIEAYFLFLYSEFIETSWKWKGASFVDSIK